VLLLGHITPLGAVLYQGNSSSYLFLVSNTIKDAKYKGGDIFFPTQCRSEYSFDRNLEQESDWTESWSTRDESKP